MARKTSVVTEYTDDLDGSKAVATVQFSIDGVGYEIDLSQKNVKAINSAFAPYVEAGRKVRTGRRRSGTARPSRSSRASSTPARSDLADVRAWARDNGYEVAERGRLAGEIIEAYDAR